MLPRGSRLCSFDISCSISRFTSLMAFAVWAMVLVWLQDSDLALSATDVLANLLASLIVLDQAQADSSVDVRQSA